MTGNPVDLIGHCETALGVVSDLVGRAKAAIRADLIVDGRLDKARLEREQPAAHGLAWFATYEETLRQTLNWAKASQEDGAFGTTEQALLAVGFGEYLSQIAGGIAMSQGEIARITDLHLTLADVRDFLSDPAVARLVETGSTDANWRAILDGLDAAGGQFGHTGLDETHTMIRDQFRRYADGIADAAHQWHLTDSYIPLEVLSELSDMGVFGLTIPEAYGGTGLGKMAMCVVSEELSRGYIGVGSLGTRSEIAAELIMGGGTDAQKDHWLPKIASGETLPTAVFTEPGTGSDLGSLKTRAVRDGDTYRITGNKTWITHAARADLMTLLVRTDPGSPDYRGLSMFLAEKPRGHDADPFPADGMSGSEIAVLGYRGMKEYEIAFDGFEIPGTSLLGGEEGRGFKQLMITFESARIQTAARALGVGQNALELGLKYASERVQFGKTTLNFPRVYAKIALGATELMMCRQLTWFAARQKDSGKRCDLEAGMAKLLAARVAWGVADNALQIHGGNGYAQEYPISRVLCDARILNLFEGAAEIQANVIASRLLTQAN